MKNRFVKEFDVENVSHTYYIFTFPLYCFGFCINTFFLCIIMVVPKVVNQIVVQITQLLLNRPKRFFFMTCDLTFLTKYSSKKV